MTPVAYLVLIMAAYICSVVFHEAGHWIALHSHFPDTQIVFEANPEVKLATMTDGDVSEEQLYGALVLGILSGLIPFMIFSYFIDGGLLISLPYFLFIKEDLKQIIKSLRGGTK